MNKAQLTQLRKENRTWQEHLVSVPRKKWPFTPRGLKEVWRSRDYLVQVYEEKGYERISISRTDVPAYGKSWDDRIPWDDLQRLKRECGRGDAWAVEVYPADEDLVNVANMRHLFLVNEPPEFAWRKRESE